MQNRAAALFFASAPAKTCPPNLPPAPGLASRRAHLFHRPMQLLVATRNAHKTDEIRAMLGPGWIVKDLNAHPEIPAPEETGDTFQANAEIKALAASQLFPGLVLADDSGLEVDALGGAPGVRSARYAGDGATDAANRERLLAELERVGARGKSRSARFRCALVLAEAGRAVGTFGGSVEGIISPVERGEGGFGYDKLFVPEGECASFGELAPEIKNRMSHRSRALARIIAYLTETRGLPAHP